MRCTLFEALADSQFKALEKLPDHFAGIFNWLIGNRDAGTESEFSLTVSGTQLN